MDSPVLSVAVIGDSHRDQSALTSALYRVRGANLLIFLGDCVEDGRLLAEATGLPMLCVRGNNDFRSDIAEEIVTEVLGARTLIVHGHRLMVKFTLSQLTARASAVGAGVALFGHTHRPLLERHGDVLLVNPGALCGRMGMPGTFAWLRLEAGEVRAEIEQLG